MYLSYVSAMYTYSYRRVATHARSRMRPIFEILDESEKLLVLLHVPVLPVHLYIRAYVIRVLVFTRFEC